MASAWYRIKQEDGSTLWFEPGRQVVCENGSDEEQRLTPLESRILGVLVGRRQRISGSAAFAFGWRKERAGDTRGLHAFDQNASRHRADLEGRQSQVVR